VLNIIILYFPNILIFFISFVENRVRTNDSCWSHFWLFFVGTWI